jgi:hypothetical protein
VPLNGGGDIQRGDIIGAIGCWPVVLFGLPLLNGTAHGRKPKKNKNIVPTNLNSIKCGKTNRGQNAIFASLI